MKIFIDSADIEEINDVFSWGVGDGVTTNPSLIKKAVEKHVGIDLKSYIKKILRTSGDSPVSLEVTKTTAEEMISEAKKLYDLFEESGNVNIKVPVNPAFEDGDNTHFDGIKVLQELKKSNIPTNATLIFTPEQALLAAKAGADYISPFAGRIDDHLRKSAGLSFEKTDYFPRKGMSNGQGLLHDEGIVSGVHLVEECVDILEKHGYGSEVIAASLRNTRQVREAALVGAHIATIPYDVIKDMLKHPKTFEGMVSFTKDVVKEYEDLK
ncbi:transaldolase [Candidatus Woesearchaeota archaeon]|nr:transaldolase [Candidatus Woesearchaeota archaeon]